MALRIDIGALRPAKNLPDGRVRAEAHIARIGVQEYLDEKGRVVRELRAPEEVFSRKSMDSFAMVPVTSTHPTEKVTADNARQYMVGASGERVERDDDWLRTELMIADAPTLEEMRADKKYEVSCGYTCDVVQEKGVHPVYGAYDARQTNIVGNHIAVNIHRGRASTDAVKARVRMDHLAEARAARRELRCDDAAVATRLDAVLTNAVDGHQHLVELQPDYGDRMSGTTSWALASGASSDHAHAWIRNNDGTIEIAESGGHTHSLEDASGLDSDPRPRQDDVVKARPAPNNPSRGRQMPPAAKNKTDEKNLLDAAATQLVAAETRADAAEEQLGGEKKRADAAEGRVASLEKEIESLKANRLDQKEIDKRDLQIDALSKKLAKETSRADAANDPKFLDKKVQRRVKIVKACETILGDKLVTDSAAVTDDELMCMVVEKLQGVDIRKDDEGNARSAEYIAARFDAAVEGFASGVDALDRLRDLTRTNHVEEPRHDAASARADYVNRQQNAWKPPKAAAK